MSVVLNEGALRRLLDSEDGEVAEVVHERAGRVLEEARAGAGRIMHRFPGDIGSDVDLERQPDGAFVVGIRDVGRISRYLAGKEAREQAWLVPALAVEFSR